MWIGTAGPKDRRIALYAREGLLVGAMGMGIPGAVMPLRGLIEAAVPVSEVTDRFAAVAAATALPSV